MALDDPGWGKPKDIAIGAAVPMLAVKRAAADAPGGQLVVLRTLTLAFAAAMVLIGVITVIVTATGGDPSDVAPAAAAGCAGFATAAVLLATRIMRTLGCGPPAQMTAAYRSRLLLRLAICESGALAAFVLSFLTSSPLPYAAALPVALIGIFLIAPSARNLRAEDERLSYGGCGTSLHQALITGGTAADPTS